MMNPAGGNTVARGKSEGPKCGGKVSTFITQISSVTVHVLHGEPKFVLSAYHGPLTSECQLHMCTSLDRSQANTLHVGNHNKYTSARHEPLDRVDQERITLQSWQSSPQFCWIEFWHQKSRDEPRFLTTGPNMTSILPRGDRETTLHPARVSQSTTRVPLSRVVERVLGRYGYLALSFGKRKCWCGTAGMCGVRQIA